MNTVGVRSGGCVLQKLRFRVTRVACVISRTSWCCKWLWRLLCPCDWKSSPFVWRCCKGCCRNSRTSCPAFLAHRYRTDTHYCTRRTSPPTRSSTCRFCISDNRIFAAYTLGLLLWLFFRLVIRVDTISSCSMLNRDSGLCNGRTRQTSNTVWPSCSSTVLVDVLCTRSNLFDRYSSSPKSAAQ